MAITGKLEPRAYTPLGISYLQAASVKDARKEYTRLRDIANKRLNRLRASKFAKQPEVRNFYANGIPKLSDLGDVHDLERALSRLYEWLSGPSTIKEMTQRLDARILRTLHQNRFYVDKKDLAAFGRFMDYMAARLKSLMIPSEVIAEYYVESRKKGLSGERLRRDFEAFLEREYDTQLSEIAFDAKDIARRGAQR